MLVVRGGGTLPIGGTLDRELGVPQLGFGFGAGENVHAPNEYIVIDHFYLGIETAIHFYYNLADGA
jgi:acetylornithine deacetylase/succinyl-diaminopimelate desuccinylase-like protein